MAGHPPDGGLIPVRPMPNVAVRVSIAAELLSAIVEADFRSDERHADAGSLAGQLTDEYWVLRGPFRPVFMHGLALRDAVLADLGPDAPAHAAFEAFDRYLATLSPDTWVQWACESLHTAAEWRARQGDGIVPPPPPAPELRRFEAARACVGAVIRRGLELEGMPNADPDTAARLVADGVLLAAHVRRMAALLWGVIEPSWAARVAALRSLAAARGRVALPADAGGIFAAITGLRPVEADRAEIAALAGAERIAFYPVLHNAGFSSVETTSDGQAFVVFEVGLLATGGDVEAADADVPALLLGAADPFRWRVLSLLAAHGPLYTQDILALTDAAQSTASRHLRDMEQVGLLRATHEGRRTRYALEGDRIRSLADRLSELARTATRQEGEK